jgi:hypothetical protein
MLISNSSINNITDLRSRLENILNSIDSLEGAAKTFVNDIYQKFKESIVLLRLFVTIPYSNLPPDIRTSVQNLAKVANLTLNEKSIILTLFGTVGERDEWSDRKKSKGHQGIPLASKEFVDSIPMMSALLEQLDFDLGWLRDGKEIPTRLTYRLGGTFYVEDASSAKDKKGRLIIQMQEFVKEFNIKTVFGFGGDYSSGGKFLTVICFIREHITINQALLFESLGNSFKIETMDLISNKTKYFK